MRRPWPATHARSRFWQSTDLARGEGNQGAMQRRWPLAVTETRRPLWKKGHAQNRRVSDSFSECPRVHREVEGEGYASLRGS
jgi:hypothetical protein